MNRNPLGPLVWKQIWLQYPKTIPTFFPYQGYFCLKIQTDWSNRTKYSEWKPFCLQTYDDHHSTVVVNKLFVWQV